MPLKKRGKTCVPENIRELHKANARRSKKRANDQIIAMSLNACGKDRKQSAKPRKAKKAKR